MKNKITSIFVSIAILIQMIPILAVNGEETSTDALVRQHIAETSDEIGSDNYSEFFYYDDQGRICGRKVITEDTKKEYTYTYNSDRTFTESVIVTERSFNQTADLMKEDDAPFQTFEADSKITSPELKKTIEDYKSLWQEADSCEDLAEEYKTIIKKEANLQALIARADYCIKYPQSQFAYSFLPDGRLDTGFAFRRAIDKSNTDEFSLDVLAIQRALIAYGYLSVDDLTNEEYGYYNEVTQDAVKNYSYNKLGREQDNITGLMISRLFDLDNEMQKAKLSHENLRGMAMYIAQHETICTYFAASLIKEGTVYREGYLYEAGVEKRGGRFDVACKIGNTNYVWEIKPDSKYGRSDRSARQIQSYVDASKKPINMYHEKYGVYCPLKKGEEQPPGFVPWSKKIHLIYSPITRLGTRVDGIVYYYSLKGELKEYELEKERVLASAPVKNEEYVRVAAPDWEDVKKGLMITAGVTIIAIIVVAGVAAVLTAPPTVSTVGGVVAKCITFLLGMAPKFV